ncbi:hypothetical protein [Mucilaginibacter sp. L196]|uniref:hypothetical protein n=1 Tax=Mucilaginibacter sp. L196 TaxID=1641870 RepID=UPI00131B6E66|nr:hypothetical protein [Mucilaginibacter sp. L196]
MRYNEDNSDRSGSVIEIITNKPGFFNKWALYTVLIALTLLFWALSFVSYPETAGITCSLKRVSKIVTPLSNELYLEMAVSKNTPNRITIGETVQLGINKLLYAGSSNFMGIINSVDKTKCIDSLILIVKVSHVMIQNQKEIDLATRNKSLRISMKVNQNVLEVFYYNLLKGIER